MDATGFEAQRARLRRRRRHGRPRGRREGQRQGRPRHPAPLPKHARDGVIPAIRRAFSRDQRRHLRHRPGEPGVPRDGHHRHRAVIFGPKARGSGTSATAAPTASATGIAEQLTFDHSWVWEIAKRQGVDPDELGDFKKNVIIRSLGPDPDVEVDIEGPHPVQPGDMFLLCSDGLTGRGQPEPRSGRS